MGLFQEWKAKAQGDAFAQSRVQAYQKRPEYELYDLEADPYEMHNLGGRPGMAEIFERLRTQLEAWMKQQGDLGRATEAQAKERQIERPL